MRTRSACATALYLLLLLTALVEAGGHELWCHDGPARLGFGPDSSAEGLQIGPGDAAHDDECPYCGLCSSRVSPDPSSTDGPTLELAEVQAAERGVLFVEAQAAGPLSRGPPAR